MEPLQYLPDLPPHVFTLLLLIPSRITAETKDVPKDLKHLAFMTSPFSISVTE